MKKILLTLVLLFQTVVAQDLNILFDSNSYEIKQSEIVKLDKYVDYLFTNPELSVILEGHADSIDTYKYNLDLSIKRAQAVKKYFVDQGILNIRVKTTGFGETKQKVSNMLKDGRETNRRVSASIVEQQ